MLEGCKRRSPQADNDEDVSERLGEPRKLPPADGMDVGGSVRSILTGVKGRDGVVTRVGEGERDRVPLAQ